MKQFLKRTVRRLTGFYELQRPLQEIASALTGGQTPTEPGASGPRYRQLPGSQYATVTMPLDYPPSRDLKPRWGKSQPPIRFLTSWFAQHETLHRELFADMKKCVGDLRSVPKVFDDRKLPIPAWTGVPFAPFDSVALYMMIKKYKPKRYLEIGSGISTCFAYKAITEHCTGTTITSIDPQPRASIDAICDRVIRDGLETCDLSIFDELEPNDILFMDGSHRSFMNSDVTVFMIDVLPRLKPGVIVHVHDIVLPYDYDQMFLHWYWSEQYLLAVYLMNAAHRITPLFPTSFICHDPIYEDLFQTPLIDLGDANDGWRGGGSMWFTHTTPLLVPS
jgi:hypothetical protein